MKKVNVGEGIPIAKIAEVSQLTIKGSSTLKIKGITSLDSPIEGHIAFANSKSLIKLLPELNSSTLAALIIDSSLDTEKLPKHITYLPSSEPLRSFLSIISLFFQPYDRSNSISERAAVHPSCKIGKNVSIADFVSIAENCVIGNDVVIHANVTIYPEVTIGDGTIIHAGAVVRERCILAPHVLIQNGAVIGADGFGYIPDPVEGIRSVPQVGIVRLEQKVDVGANSCVDRAAFGETHVGKGTKIDNLVQVGHNAQIGQFSLLCAGTAIAGSSKIGNQVTIGGHTAVTGHISITDNVRIAGHGGVTKSITEKGDYGGYPAVPVVTWRRQVAAIKKLPELIRSGGLLKGNQSDEGET